MKFYIVTQGCKVNQYESHALHEAFERAGFCNSLSPELADFILVHSCAITAKAVADLRNILRKLVRVAPQSKIILTGCAVKIHEELGTLEGVHALLSQSEKAELALHPSQKIHQVIGRLAMQVREGMPIGSVAPTELTVPIIPAERRFPTEFSVPAEFNERTVSFETPHAFDDFSIAVQQKKEQESVEEKYTDDSAFFPPFHIRTYGRSRALVKIQDGCSHGCTYCIVPFTRGISCSRPVQESLAEIEGLLDAGYREIGINGVNLRQYGKDFKHPHDFWDFMHAVEERFSPDWAGKIRFRISSLEPLQLNEKGLDCLASSTLIAPHLHISLQSGSKSVLKRMGRGHYDPDTIVSFIHELQKKWPIFGLGADIITGFPEETTAEFTQTLQLCEKLPFSYAHIFPYSRRPKTVADRMSGHIPQKIKKERVAILRDCMAVKKQIFLHKLLALPQVFVVVEQRQHEATKNIKQDKHWQGVNEFYSECLFVDAPSMGKSLALTTALPVGIKDDKLLVRA